jgi:hypothetical protein
MTHGPLNMGLGTVLVIYSLLSGCVAGSTLSHDDGPGAANRDAGPLLCRDGEVPPCTPRS